jgi:hypothetical protein
MLGSLINTLSNIIIGLFFGVKYYVLILKITLLKQNLYIYIYIIFIHLFLYFYIYHLFYKDIHAYPWTSS